MSECWEVGGYLHHTGYGYVSFEGRRWLAHRLAWTMREGPIPPGLSVLHHCDNRSCVNVDHLFLGTIGDNNRDRHAKGRSRNQNAAKTACKRGHPFDETNTRITPQGWRECRECANRRESLRDPARPR